MIQSALIFATSSTREVMLLKSCGSSLGPGAAVACQPISGMPAALAFSTSLGGDFGVEAADDDAVRLEVEGLA